MEEDDNITFTYWKRVDEYRDPVDTTSLSTNFAAVFQEAERLLNLFVEQIVILNDTPWENNKILREKSNETVKFHSM